MSIYSRVDALGNIEIHVSKDSSGVFKELVHRGTNLWPDAPAEIKWMADILTSGKPMQDYFANPHLAGKVRTNPADREYAQVYSAIAKDGIGNSWMCMFCGGSGTHKPECTNPHK